MEICSLTLMALQNIVEVIVLLCLYFNILLIC